MIQDLSGRISVFELAGFPELIPLLQPVLSLNVFSQTTIAIVLDWSRPLEFVERLSEWLGALEDFVLELTRESDGEFQQVKHESESLVPTFSVLRPSNNATLRPLEKDYENWKKKTAEYRDVKDSQLPLEDEVLTHNLGLDLVLICNKVLIFYWFQNFA
jgi:hypothetical protein